MLRVLLFLCLLALLALGIDWLVERPGQILLTWQGYRIETSVAVGFAVLCGAAVVLTVVWSLVRFIFKIPSLVSLSNRLRRRNKGYAALSRGMIAAGAGDARAAKRAATETRKHLADEPLALLLQAQAAQLEGDRDRAAATFSEMAQRPDTRLLGLRGLHVEAQRRGDADAAHHFAREAHAIAPLPWSGKAVLDHRAAQADWEGALATLESNVAAKLVDKETAQRQRAVLETAIAIDKSAQAPEEALRLVTAALRRAPALVPALALAARLLGRKGEIRKAAKLIEGAWPRSAHPELADVYVNLRPGDSNADRLVRAKTLARLAPRAPDSQMAVARVALAARDFASARKAMAPLVSGETRPSARMCLIMAELEEAEHADAGLVREWLARASRAPRDPVWIADGVAVDTWAPASPVTGQLDAFVWQRAVERLTADMDASDPAAPIQVAPPPAALPEPVAPQPVEEPEAPVPDTPPPPTVIAPAQPISEASPTPLPAVPVKSVGPVIFPHPGAPDDPGLEEAVPPADRAGRY